MENKKSFTVIELLIVISIIGLISSIVLVRVQDAREKARIASAFDFSQTVQNTLGSYAVGIWRFDENSGSIAYDFSGYGNNGTIQASIQFRDDTPNKIVGAGKGKYALDFYGNDCVQVSNHPSLNVVKNITIEMWVKQTIRRSNWTWLLSKGFWGSYHVISEDAWATNQIGFTVKVGGTDYRLWTSKPLKLGKWTHLLFTYNSVTGVQQIYFNGELDAETSQTPGDIDTITDVLRISGTGTRSFDGLIDEVRIYDRVLTTAQIQQRYLAGLEKYFSYFK